MTGMKEAAAGAALMLLAVSAARADDPGLLAVGAGAYDFDHKQPAGEVRAEYRFASGFFFIKPLVGVLATNRETVDAYGGLRADFIFLDHWVLMPNASVGYFDRGSGKNLGSHLEFKTGVELAWRFDNAMRLGIAFDHISNAGITKVNPGTENVLLVFSLPIGW